MVSLSSAMKSPPGSFGLCFKRHCWHKKNTPSAAAGDRKLLHAHHFSSLLAHRSNRSSPPPPSLPLSLHLSPWSPPPLHPQPPSLCIFLLLYKWEEGRERENKNSSWQNKCCNHSSYFTAWALLYFPSSLHLEWGVLGEGGGGHCHIYCLGAQQPLGIFGLLHFFFICTSDLNLFYFAQDNCGISLRHKSH